MFPVVVCNELRSKSIGVDAFLAIMTSVFRDSKVINGMILLPFLSPSPDMASPLHLLSLVLR